LRESKMSAAKTKLSSMIPKMEVCEVFSVFVR
jgi:hypothetical protein